MKGKFTHIESKGLPGGPNEMFTYTTGVFSVKGYKRDSPDVDNPFNIIPSGNITMKDVDFPVLGTDNLGNSKVMMPGNDYKFPGDMVFETPMAQRGKEITPYQSQENAKAVYDPVYNKLAKAYGYDPESTSTFGKLLNDKRINEYVRSGIEEAYGYSIADFESGRRRVPPLEGGIKDFQKLILDASDEELRNLLKKDYSDIGLTNFKSYLPEQLSYGDALKYMKKFYDYIGEGYTFQEGGGVARESTAVNRPMMLPDNFDPGPVVPPTVAEVKGLKPTSSGEIRASEAPSTAKKVMNRAANPMSAFKYFATGEQAPEMIPDKEVPLDYAMDVINPFAWLDYAIKAGRDIREGDYVGAAFNVLGATPVIPATAKPMSRIIKNAPSRVNPNYFKPNEDLWYRQVGKSAIDDISKSKMIRERGEDIAQSRAKYDEAVMKMKGIDPATGKEYTDYTTKYQQMTLGARKPPSPYFSKGELFWGMDRRPGMRGLKGRGLDADSRYLIESKLSDEAFHPAYVKGLKTDYTGEKLFGTTAILKPMSEFRNPADFNLYRRNWWSGYKPIRQEGGETDPKFLQNKVVERFATGDKLPYKPGKGPTRPNKYTVQTGDTLYGIARKKDTSVKDLESWNKDLEPNKLKAGQIINLPTGSPDVPMGITSELLRRQAFKESSFDPNAISKSGYKGLGQIGDAVMSDYLKRNKLEGEIDPFDPKQNSDVQKWYMDQLYNASFVKKGNPSDKVRIAKALAAYNAGPGTLLEVLEDQKKKGVDIYNSLDWLQGMPKEETRGYIKAILLGEDEQFEKWYDDAKKNPENKKYLDLFNKAQDGAEITLMDLYKGYIYDQFTDKAMQQKAKDAYDKLNRVYYRDAKAAGMSVPNYIMTNMNKL